MFGNKFQSLVFVGAHSDALPIRKHEPLMAANFLDHIFCHLGAQPWVKSSYTAAVTSLLTTNGRGPSDVLVVISAREFSHDSARLHEGAMASCGSPCAV